MNMKILKCKDIFLLMLLSLLAITSCTSYKKVPYLQNSAEFNPDAVVELHEARIKPQDLLNITIVNPENSSVSMAYNLITPSDPGRANSLTTQPA